MPKVLHREVTTVLEDGTKNIQITIDGSRSGEVEKIIERVRRREGLTPLSDDDLKAEAKRAISAGSSIEKPRIIHTVPPIDMTKFRRGVAKIVYELACLWLGDSYLDDPIGAKLRDYVLSDSRDDIRGLIELGLVSPLDTLWTTDAHAHIAFMSGDGQSICLGIRLFDAISGVLVLTDEPSRYPQAGEGLFVHCDPITGEKREASLSHELGRIVQSGSVPACINVSQV